MGETHTSTEPVSSKWKTTKRDVKARPNEAPYRHMNGSHAHPASPRSSNSRQAGQVLANNKNN